MVASSSSAALLLVVLVVLVGGAWGAADLGTMVVASQCLNQLMIAKNETSFEMTFARRRDDDDPPRAPPPRSEGPQARRCLTRVCLRCLPNTREPTGRSGAHGMYDAPSGY